jgi:hypothetical protein
MAETIEPGSICYPSMLKDILLMVLFPPLWVILKELYSPEPMKHFIRIVFSFVFTSCFYFPGLIHAMGIYRKEGSISESKIVSTSITPEGQLH